MADYIYLLQHRLTPTQRRALEAVRDAARGRGTPVFLVGGAVRDLTSGAPVRDLDFAVQGDVADLTEAFESAGASRADQDPVTHARYLVFPGGVRVEVGPTLTVSYPKPGEPEVQSAPILDDLRRRDFTANAMAISLNEGSYGLLLDPLNGVADLENRELRLVSNLGFIEQPALLVRAARLSARLGWGLEERTQRRYENAKEDQAIDRLSDAARAYELEEIFHEEDPVAAMEHLEAEGWLKDLSPLLTGIKVDRDGLDKVRDALGQMEHLGIFADPSPVYFPLLAGRLAGEEVTTLKAGFARAQFVRQIESLEARSKELATQMGSKSSSSASATWKLLFAAEPEVVLALASSMRSPALQAKLKAFFNDWPQARQKIPYALMQEMRITPELPGYGQLLEDLFYGLIDGRLNTPEELRAFLEPFSPPAPAQQVTPRRRAAKSTRGRGRQAAVVAAPVEMDEDDSELDEEASAADANHDDEPEEVEDDEAEDSVPTSPSISAVSSKANKAASKPGKDKAPEEKQAGKAQAITTVDSSAMENGPTDDAASGTPAEAPRRALKVSSAGAVASSKAPSKTKERPLATAKAPSTKVVVVPAHKLAAEGKGASTSKKQVQVKDIPDPEKTPTKGPAKAVATPAKVAEKSAARSPADTIYTKAEAKSVASAKKSASVPEPSASAKAVKKTAPVKRTGR